MDDQDIKDINETLTAGEAAMSANVRGYYKGFSIQITCRDPQVKVKPLLDKCVEIAEYMNNNGWKPSWNDTTNQANNKPKTVTSEIGTTTVPTCPYHNKQMTLRDGQYGQYWSCGTKLDDGTWCKYKPNQRKDQPKAQPEPVTYSQYLPF